MDAILSALVSFFLISPLEASLTQMLTGAGVPKPLVEQVTACAATAAPVIVKRATNEPVWLIGSIIGLWTGSNSPDKILVDAAPGCAEPVAAARAYFTKAV